MGQVYGDDGGPALYTDGDAWRLVAVSMSASHRADQYRGYNTVATDQTVGLLALTSSWSYSFAWLTRWPCPERLC